MTKICSVEGCSKPHKAKGFCDMHYYRFLTHGDPLGGRTFVGDPLKYLLGVVMHHTDECIAWPFSKDRYGYGIILVNGENRYVHREVCEKVHGPAPTPEHQAAHSCGKGHEACCAPNHVGWKTRKENMDDQIAHGTRPYGRRRTNAVLTEDAVREIRSMRSSMVKVPIIAEKLGVSLSTVWSVIYKKNWGWVDEQK